jgi:hypothetical protein
MEYKTIADKISALVEKGCGPAAMLQVLAHGHTIVRVAGASEAYRLAGAGGDYMWRFTPERVAIQFCLDNNLPME